MRWVDDPSDVPAIIMACCFVVLLGFFVFGVLGFVSSLVMGGS